MGKYITNLFIIVGFIVIWGNCSLSEIGKDVELSEMVKVSIDPDQVQPTIDVSSVIEDSIIVIPLEYCDDSSISDIGKMEICDEHIFISDKLQNKIIVFDSKGKYIRSIGKRGNAPGEYVQMMDFMIKGDSIFIQDVRRNKYVIYNIFGDFITEFNYTPTHFELFSLNNKTYFVSNYFIKGYYNLFEFDLNKQKIVNSYLPYMQKMTEERYNILLENQTTQCYNHVLLNFTFNDTIYKLENGQVNPYLIVEFAKRKMPDNLQLQNTRFPLLEINKRGLLKGLECIEETGDYIWGYYTDYRSRRYVLYDKNKNVVQVGENFTMNQLGDMPFLFFYKANNRDEIIFKLEPYELILNWGNLKYFKKNVKDVKMRKYIDSLVNNVTDESNPVLFRCKVK